MYKSLRNIDINLKARIFDDYINKAYSIEKIQKKYDFFHNDILAIIGQKQVRIEDYPDGIIDHKCFIAIADCHIGSIYEKAYYYEALAKILIDNNISDIIIAGDFLQGNMEPLDDYYSSPYAQITHAIDLIPNLNDVTWHILFGNHDLQILSKGDKYLKILKSRKDFHLLGFKHTYMKFGKFLFSISHKTPRYKITSPSIEADFSLVGHGHFEGIKNKKIYLPPFCLDTKNGTVGSPYPGFIVAKKYNDEIVFFYYIFNEKTTKNTTDIELIKLKDEKTNPMSMGKILSISNEQIIKRTQ